MGMGHPSNVVARAKVLAEAGWTAAQIARRIPSEFPGIAPAETTVRRWIDPDYAERQREHCRTGGAETRRWGWRRRLARIRQLREAGIGFDAIAKLAHLDFDLDLSKRQLQAITRGEYTDFATRQLLGGEA